MLKHYLKSKLHGLRVVETNVNYRGSITIDQALLEAADISPFEMVDVVNVTNGERFRTYAIKGCSGSGYVALNGGAAKLAEPGDTLLVFSTVIVKKKNKFETRLVIVDSENKIEEIIKEKISA